MEASIEEEAVDNSHSTLSRLEARRKEKVVQLTAHLCVKFELEQR